MIALHRDFDIHRLCDVTAPPTSAAISSYEFDSHTARFISSAKMTDKFTAQHRFLLAAWYEVYRSPIVVQRLYRQRFGRNVSIPSATSIKAMHKKASVNGTLEDLPRSGRPATSHTPENIDLVAETFCSNPRTFTRRASLELGIPRSTVVRILHEQKLHPYKLRQFHELSAEDLAERQRFAEDFGQVRYVRLFSLL